MIGVSIIPLRCVWGRYNLNLQYIPNKHLNFNAGFVSKYSQKESLANYYYGMKFHFGLEASTSEFKKLSGHLTAQFLYADVDQFNRTRKIYSFTSAGYAIGVGLKRNFALDIEPTKNNFYLKFDAFYQYLPFNGSNIIEGDREDDHPPGPIWIQTGFGSQLEIQLSFGWQFHIKKLKKQPI